MIAKDGHGPIRPRGGIAQSSRTPHSTMQQGQCQYARVGFTPPCLSGRVGGGVNLALRADERDGRGGYFFIKIFE
jgi:hypothetical protein